MQYKDIPCTNTAEEHPVGKTCDELAGPCILKGKARDWSVVKTWNPFFFKDRYGHIEVPVSMNLPEEGAPYFSTESQHRKKLSLADFIDHLYRPENIGGSYLDQCDIAQLEGLEADFDLYKQLPSTARFTSLWIGDKTRSGLHYDNMDNMYIQVYGNKKVYLIAPQDNDKVYPFGDCISKSKVDPENPDLSKFPKFSQATVYYAHLEAGDILHFPKGWWHHFVSTSQSISISCWYGNSLPIADQISGVNAAGYFLWLSIIRDFFWHGLLDRPYTQRLFSSPPTGKILFDLLFRKI